MLPESFIYACYFLFGLIFGSFANVLVLRIPAEKSIVPSSKCPQCSKAIAWFDNIPVLSWLALKGKCRNCKKSISFRYPLIELICGFLFMLVYYKFGFSYFGFEFLIFAYFAYVASIIDLEHMILPDIFTIGGCAVGLLGAFLNPERSFYDAILGLLLGGGFLYLVAYFGYLVYKKEVMGGGDIKLLAWIGSVLGVHAIFPTIVIAGLVPGFVGVIIMIIQRKRLTAAIPFGPFLVFGAIACVFIDYPTIVQWLFPFPLNQ
ncbi:MAG: prepilin peptidase [Bdellovibrionaceae bacterium]|nr:prepilin peptidase [Pseudobdellovibrionaceae bacterium]